jgi:hypothetical protein
MQFTAEFKEGGTPIASVIRTQYRIKALWVMMFQYTARPVILYSEYEYTQFPRAQVHPQIKTAQTSSNNRKVRRLPIEHRNPVAQRPPSHREITQLSKRLRDNARHWQSRLHKAHGEQRHDDSCFKDMQVDPAARPRQAVSLLTRS